jgi:large subunit ribosomal protein L25
MSEFEISAVARDALGKAATRRLRKTGLVPAILYGGTTAPISLSLRANELKKQLENEAFYSHILTVSHAGGKDQAVLKGLQRHPATDVVTHVDFQRAGATQVLHMRVPLHFVNEEICEGRKAGGAIAHMINEVEVTCLAKDLPEYIEVDIEHLQVGDLLHLSDIKCPPGIELTLLAHGDDQPVVSVHATLASSDEDVDGEGGDEAEADA